jgi:rubredoxin
MLFLQEFARNVKIKKTKKNPDNPESNTGCLKGKKMKKFKCSICGYIYEESKGIPEKGIKPGTKWEDLPEDFTCPLCNALKSLFVPVLEAPHSQEKSQKKPEVKNTEKNTVYHEPIKELTAGEISAICSNLAKGCEKQRLLSEMEAFYKIADYFKSKAAVNKETPPGKETLVKDVSGLLSLDMTTGFSAANKAAKLNEDRGALRSLVWSEKVSTMIKSLLERYAKEGDAMLENTSLYVCDICGFIWLGDKLPDICPVCKVPKHKMIKIERKV